MSVRSLLRQLATLLFPVALLSTIYLYSYPVSRGCAFPTLPSTPSGDATDHSSEVRHVEPALGNGEYSVSAPFRLLVLADPQLEGDSSLPNPDHALLPRLIRHWQKVNKYNLSYT